MPQESKKLESGTSDIEVRQFELLPLQSKHSFIWSVNTTENITLGKDTFLMIPGEKYEFNETQITEPWVQISIQKGYLKAIS